MAATKLSSALAPFNNTITSSSIPLWARDAIVTAILQLDTPAWRETLSDYLPTFCETVPRIQELFMFSDVRARERILSEVYKGASRFHEALRYLNIRVPCNYTQLNESDTVTIRTGYILCFVFRLIELIYHYGNGQPPPTEHWDIAHMAKKFEQTIFGGPVSLIFMQSELHIATEYLSEITEKPTYAPLTGEIIAALNHPDNPEEGAEACSSEFVCGFLGRHQLRPIDAIISEQFDRDVEAQVAWEIMFEGYTHRKRRGFMSGIVMRVFQ
ncbi:hypothetical protein F4808DRAFT_442076 [Astrocystis sublimbata]|nr:hypothetical protein F4808DRAFT_442076 [Astrocystis sublimbata]